MKEYTIEGLLSEQHENCSCGKVHQAHVKRVYIDKNAIENLKDELRIFESRKAYVVADVNTYNVAGEKVEEILRSEGVKEKLCVLNNGVEPDEYGVGNAVMHFENDCDIIIGIGSGVVNDICKIVAYTSSLPYIVIGTAASMDGYASSTSSVIRNGLKVSINSRCPDVVIGDIDILSTAPVMMLKSGFGDMIAKYVSLAEWKISHIVTNEYYCPYVADIVASALKKCIDCADLIESNSPEAVKSVMEGMVISGIAADFAGISRPVSGVEHYISHLWDMRSVEFKTPCSFHGIRCGIGTVEALLRYEKMSDITFDKEKAVMAFDSFDIGNRANELRNYLGKSSDVMINSLATCERYNREKFLERIDNIISNEEEIRKIIREDLPSSEEIINLLKRINAPVSASEIGIPESERDINFKLTADIRDKYVLSTLQFDLGIR